MKHFCVIGFPLGHSQSPKIHNMGFKKLKIAARYVKAEVTPAGLRGFMKTFRENFSGASVTMPYKQKIIKYMDRLSLEARGVGAVNTIINRGGVLTGDNTDVYGAMEALKWKRAKGKWKRAKGKWQREMENGKGKSGGGKLNLRGKHVTVLGAGGAARAVIYGLKKAGASVIILNRTVSKARRLAEDFKCEYGALKDFSAADTDIIINTTSVGMEPRASETPLPQLAQKIAEARAATKTAAKSKTKTVGPKFVMDVVYRPRITQLLKDARAAGCRIITGEKMFLAQAAKAFKLWTGKKLPLY